MGIIEHSFVFHHYTTDIRPWQLPNVYRSFQNFEDKFRNLKEEYAFAEEKCDIANFSFGIRHLLALDMIRRMDGATDLDVSLLLRNNLQRHMDYAKYSIKYQNDY